MRVLWIFWLAGFAGMVAGCCAGGQGQGSYRGREEFSNAEFLRILVRDTGLKVDERSRVPLSEQIIASNDALIKEMLRQSLVSQTLGERTAAVLAAESKGSAALRGMMLAIQEAIEVRMLNLANAHTDGFKRKTSRFAADGKKLEVVRDLYQGAAVVTGRPLDLYLEGSGFLR